LGKNHSRRVPEIILECRHRDDNNLLANCWSNHHGLRFAKPKRSGIQ
jgi:hypothetical protein